MPRMATRAEHDRLRDVHRCEYECHREALAVAAMELDRVTCAYYCAQNVRDKRSIGIAMEDATRTYERMRVACAAARAAMHR